MLIHKSFFDSCEDNGFFVVVIFAPSSNSLLKKIQNIHICTLLNSPMNGLALVESKWFQTNRSDLRICDRKLTQTYILMFKIKIFSDTPLQTHFRLGLNLC